MLANTTITISSQSEARTLTPVYSGISAQVYKKTLMLNSDIGENTIKEVTHFLIAKDKTSVREGNIVTYTDEFGIARKLKIVGLKFIGALYFTKLIEIKCDLL